MLCGASPPPRKNSKAARYHWHGRADVTDRSSALEEILPHNERLALVLVNLVDHANVGMIERRGRARLLLESLERLRVNRSGRAFLALTLERPV